MEPDFSKFETEMNRGFLQLLVLLIMDEPAYGYAMLKLLKERGYAMEENTLYPMLRRLEKDGMVISRWELTTVDRPRKFYRITPHGILLRRRLHEIWRSQGLVLEKMMEGIEHE